MNEQNHLLRLGRVCCLCFLTLVLTGCGDLLVDGRTLEVTASGTVQGVVILDADGNGGFDGSDPRFPGLKMELLTSAGTGSVDTATTNAAGEFQFNSVPVGEFRIGVASLPDSLEVIGLEIGTILVEPARVFFSQLGVSFRKFPIAHVRDLMTGQRVFTQGIVLNTRNQPGDGVVHIRDSNAYLRVTNVPPVGLQVGDSVRVLGRTANSGGQPILRDATIFPIRLSDTIILPVALTTDTAATAMGGTLDAALVRIQNAAITNTQVVQGVTGPYLHVTADDGSGPVVVVLRNFINFNLGQINPGTSQFTSATGLLVPVQDGAGNVTWQMTPRADSDLDVDQIGGG